MANDYWWSSHFSMANLLGIDRSEVALLMRRVADELDKRAPLLLALSSAKFRGSKAGTARLPQWAASRWSNDPAIPARVLLMCRRRI
jgi:hypothetical protein